MTAILDGPVRPNRARELLPARLPAQEGVAHIAHGLRRWRRSRRRLGGAERGLTRRSVCAVERCRSSAGATPARQLWSFQPVAIGAAVEVTRPSEPSMERVVERPREQAGRNASERRAGLET